MTLPTDPPRVLVVTSASGEATAMTPVLAALEAVGLSVRAIDAGRVGAAVDGTVDRVLRAIVGEASERRLTRELQSNPPDVVVAFDPHTAAALTDVRDQALTPAPVVAVVTDLAPISEWAQANADRYLVVDDEAAVFLEDAGAAGERILPVGAICPRVWVDAAQMSVAAARGKFKLSDGAVVLVSVAGLGFEQTSQLALQLSLAGADATFLFDAGSDVEAAQALRRNVPMLEMRAKLFGHTAEGPLLWRCADVVVARPSWAVAARALAVGTPMVLFSPDGAEDEKLIQGLEQRGFAVPAANTLMVSSALEGVLKRGARLKAFAGEDGAATVADIAWIVGNERSAVLEERRAKARESTRARMREATQAAERVAHAASVPGELEDLSGGSSDVPVEDVPDVGELAKLRAEVSTRVQQVSKTVFEAREAAERWEKRADAAGRAGDTNLRQQASRNADAERARMHGALAEMAQLEAELKRLEQATASIPASARVSRPASPPRAAASKSPSKSIDDMLHDMKQQARPNAEKSKSQAKRSRKTKRGKSAKGSIDDELAALKRKMATKKKRR